MNEDDAKAEWLHNAVGPPTRRNTTDVWPCGCSVAEYNRSLEGNDKEFMIVSLCHDHQQAYEEEQG